MATGRRIDVPAPLAEAPRFGLLASITPEKTPFEEWKNGFAYAPEGCVEGQTRTICDPVSRIDSTKPAIVEWNPYFISVNETCSTFSGYSEEELTGRVRRLLNMDTERALGHEFWTGDLASTATEADGSTPWPNDWLANVATVDILTESGAATLTHGLACLEQYLAENNGGQQGAIHATAQTVTQWESFRLLRREGNRILTFKDTVVIPSPGYPGTSPDGTFGDSNIWAYATDMPRIYLGPVQGPFFFGPNGTVPGVDYLDNTVTLEASRMALVEWPLCRHAGVRLDMDTCGIGGS